MCPKVFGIFCQQCHSNMGPTVSFIHIMSYCFGEFGTKFCKNAIITFAISVCPHATSREPLNGFSRKFILGSFTQICLHFCFLVKIGRERTLYMKTYQFCAPKYLGGEFPSYFDFHRLCGCPGRRSMITFRQKGYNYYAMYIFISYF